MTNPTGTGWFDRYGLENATKCQGTFGQTYMAANGARANMRLGKRDFCFSRTGSTLAKVIAVFLIRKLKRLAAWRTQSRRADGIETADTSGDCAVRGLPSTPVVLLRMKIPNQSRW